jgi:hypothetical protein
MFSMWRHHSNAVLLKEAILLAETYPSPTLKGEEDLELAVSNDVLQLQTYNDP